MRHLLFLVLSLAIFNYFGQTKQIVPVSNSLKNIDLAVVSIISLPSFDIQKIVADEHQNRMNKTGKYMFGYEHQVNIDFFEESSTLDLPDEATLYLLTLKSNNALSINIIFNDFYIPKGARLHVYDKNKTTIIGAYTSDNNNPNHILGTDLIKGEEMVIEYYEPLETKGKSKLNINTVVHGFEDINNWYEEQKVNESGGCNMDVICPDGIPWNNEIRSVARITNGGGLCSGALVNNTANDGKPYFLTANHCGPQSMAGAVFRFNYDSPICGSQISANSLTALENNTINGSTFLARSPASDFGLVELNSIPPSNYNVYYSGWNNSGDIPTKTVGIHHPSGDVKKLAFDDDAPVSGTFGSSAPNAEWRIIQWDRNTTTEGGSSGSGLWDENKLLVGQLHGGSANCANSVNDYYGKFSVSWDGNSSTSRLKDWLDPLNSGVTTLEGYDPNATLNDVNLLRILSPDSINCGTIVSTKVLVRNEGLELLTSMEFNYGLNGNISANYSWIGNIEPGDTSIIILPAIGGIINGENNISASITNPNNGTDGNIANNTLENSFINHLNCLAYPNPFKEQLIINFEIEKTNSKPVFVYLTDIQGKLLWSIEYNPQSNSQLIYNTSQIAVGTYFLKIDYEKESTVQKVIKG